MNEEYAKVSRELKEKTAFADSEDAASMEGLREKIEQLNSALEAKDAKLAKYSQKYDDLREANKTL